MSSRRYCWSLSCDIVVVDIAQFLAVFVGDCNKDSASNRWCTLDISKWSNERFSCRGREKYLQLLARVVVRTKYENFTPGKLNKRAARAARLFFQIQLIMMLIDFWLCRCLRHFFKSLIPKDSNSDYGLVENYRFVLCEKRKKKRLEDLTLESEKKGEKNCSENGHFKFFGHFAKAIVRWPTRDMLQIKKLLHANKMKLLQIKKRCCKLKNITANKVKVAANFQNELLQIKRMLLQVKTSKVCARTEGRRSGH